MTKRLCLMLVCALALATGCGGGGGGSSNTTGLGKGTIAAARHNQSQALADCRQASRNPALTATEKTILQSECADIQTGDSAALKTDGKRLCEAEAATQPKDVQASLKAGCLKNSG
ncbi:MAG TPA: hypothetical protein VGH24_04380 [Solirubrobacteraceae bacterium]